MAKKKESLKKIQGNELLDLLENTGVMQEVNRTFFHPIGLNLKLENDLSLSLEATDDPKGFILHTINKYAMQAYNDYRKDKHITRQQTAGFIIQTRDMIRSEKLTTSITPPKTLKLQALLNELDSFTYNIKKKLMESSNEKDNDLDDFEVEMLIYKAQEKMQKGDLISASAYTMMANRYEKINERLKDIRQIEKDQRKVYKEVQ